MSNCINSGIKKIYILTQFNSQSLNRHISRTYNLGDGMNFGDGFVEVCNNQIMEVEMVDNSIDTTENFPF